MLIADSHEFIELYRGDKDLRMGMEMVALRPDLRFASFAPNCLSPTDRARFGARWIAEVGLPPLPDRMEPHLLPALGLRFARKESGGIVSFMPTYGRELKRIRPDVILENPFSWLTPRSYQTHHVATALDVPVVFYDPGDDIPIGWKHRTMALWETRILNDVAAIITFNIAGARRFVDKYNYPESRICVVPKPVDVARFRKASPFRASIRRELGLTDDHCAVGYLGRLAHYKGSVHLLEAATAALQDPSLSRLRFVFVGGGLATNEAGSTYELPNTQVTGMVPNAQIPGILAALDVLVFPDVTRPGGFPTAVAEAIAAGKTMIVGVGWSTKFMPLRDERTALLVEAGSAKAILDALRRLVSDPILADRLAQSAARLGRERMDYPVVAANWLQVVDNVRRRRSGRE